MPLPIKRISWSIFVILAILVGLYPLLYLGMDGSVGLLSTKSDDLLSDNLWNVAFYGHISFGGVALLVGWIQFSRRFRKRYLLWHRRLGLLYVLTVVVSGLCGLYIGWNATGGWVATLGFMSLAGVWLSTTVAAYLMVMRRQLERHAWWMVYSYAACFGAVTLRIWLPVLTIVMGGFHAAYPVVAWLSWVPNMVVAYILTGKATLRHRLLPM